MTTLSTPDASGSTNSNASAGTFDSTSTLRRGPYRVMVFAIAFSAFALRLGHEPLWLDETYSFAMLRHGFADVVRLTTADVHPPFYYLLLKAVTSVSGDTPAGMRVCSALAAAALVALGAGPVARIWNDRTGWVFIVLALFSPGLLCFAQEARMYALAALLVTCAVLYGHLAVRDGRRADFAAFGLFTWAAALTHYFALVAVGWNAGILLFVAGKSKNPRLRPLLLAVACAATGFLPWLPFFWTQLMAVTQEFWIPPTSGELLVFGLVAPFTYKFEDLPYPWQAVAAVAGAIAVTIAALGVGRFRNNRADVLAQVHLLLVFALTFAFGVAFSFLVRPIFMPRYMVVCAGLFLLALAASITCLPSKAALVTSVVFVLLGLPAWLRIQTQTFNGPFARLAQAVHTAGLPIPVLVHNGIPFSFALDPARHAVPLARHVVVVPAGKSFDATGGGLFVPPRAEAITDLDALANTTDRIWFVDGIPGPAPTDSSRLDNDPSWMNQGPFTLEEPMSWVRLVVRRYERKSQRPLQ